MKRIEVERLPAWMELSPGIYSRSIWRVTRFSKPQTQWRMEPWASWVDEAVLMLKRRLKRLGLRRARISPWWRGVEIWEPPIYAQPGRLDDAAYLDIRAAYPAFLDRFWPTVWWPGCPLSPREPEGWEHLSKQIRGPMVGLLIAKPRPIWRWDGRKLQKHGQMPGWRNDAVWALMWALRLWAAEMHRLGAIHVYTDGCILDAKKVGIAKELTHSLFPWWELRIKAQGEAHVWGPGNYQVGPRRGRAPRFGFFTNLDSVLEVRL